MKEVREMKPKIRKIKWLNSYRGILIIAIVAMHISIFPVFEHLMEMFSVMRMPAFFFISGYLLSEKYTDVIFFFKHRFRQLIVPYFIFFILTILFWHLLYTLTHKDLLSTSDLLIGMIYGVPSSGLMSTAGPLWFVLALFLSEMYFIMIKIYVKSDITKLLVLTLLGIIGFLLSLYVEYRLPWNADIAFIGVVFYGLGNLSKKYDLFHTITMDNKLIKILGIILFFYISILVSFNSTNDYARDLFDNILFSLVGAMSGIIALVYLSTFKNIENSRILQYLGTNTYIILAFHNIPIMLLSPIIFKHLGFVLPSDALTQALFGIIYLALVILTLIPVIFIFNKILPFVLNKA